MDLLSPALPLPRLRGHRQLLAAAAAFAAAVGQGSSELGYPSEGTRRWSGSDVAEGDGPF